MIQQTWKRITLLVSAQIVIGLSAYYFISVFFNMPLNKSGFIMVNTTLIIILVLLSSTYLTAKILDKKLSITRIHKSESGIIFFECVDKKGRIIYIEPNQDYLKINGLDIKNPDLEEVYTLDGYKINVGREFRVSRRFRYFSFIRKKSMKSNSYTYQGVCRRINESQAVEYIL